MWTLPISQRLANCWDLKRCDRSAHNIEGALVVWIVRRVESNGNQRFLVTPPRETL